MKRKLLVGIVAVLLTSCGVDHSDFTGEWIEKTYENELLKISKVDKNYLVEISGNNTSSYLFGGEYSKKYSAKVVDDMLEINASLPLKGMIDNDGVLIIKGKEYIRFEKAPKPKFTGTWKSIAEGPYGFCVININTNTTKIELKPIDLSCQHYAYDMIFPEYKNGQIEYIRKQYDERGGSDRIKSSISLVSDNEIEISYANNYPNSERYIRQ